MVRRPAFPLDSFTRGGKARARDKKQTRTTGKRRQPHPLETKTRKEGTSQFFSLRTYKHKRHAAPPKPPFSLFSLSHLFYQFYRGYRTFSTLPAFRFRSYHLRVCLFCFFVFLEHERRKTKGKCLMTEAVAINNSKLLCDRPFPQPFPSLTPSALVARCCCLETRSLKGSSFRLPPFRVLFLFSVRRFCYARRRRPEHGMPCSLKRG